MLWLEGDQKDAVEHLSRAYEIEPGDPDIVSKLIIMLIQTNEYHKAQNIVAESLGKTADFPNARSNL
jgi:Flp pilus assembly protein TadD